MRIVRWWGCRMCIYIHGIVGRNASPGLGARELRRPQVRVAGLRVVGRVGILFALSECGVVGGVRVLEDPCSPLFASFLGMRVTGPDSQDVLEVNAVLESLAPALNSNASVNIIGNPRSYVLLIPQGEDCDASPSTFFRELRGD